MGSGQRQVVPTSALTAGMAECSLNTNSTSTAGISIQTASVPLPEDQQLKHRTKDLFEPLRTAFYQICQDLDPDTADLVKEADALLGERVRPDYQKLEPFRRLSERVLRRKTESLDELPHLEAISKECGCSPEEVEALRAGLHEKVRLDHEKRDIVTELLRVEELIERLRAAETEAFRISVEAWPQLKQLEWRKRSQGEVHEWRRR